MKVLVIGSSAREHSIIWKLNQSKAQKELFCAPGNVGIAKIAACVDIRENQIDELLKFIQDEKIDLTIVCSEVSLKLGLVDMLEEKELAVFGPNSNALKVASSKAFAKKFFYKNRIPSPRFGVFDKENMAIDYLKKVDFPVVVKLDEHTEEESVKICENRTQAINFIHGAFENFEKRVIIEEFKYGKVVTIPVITDGYNALPFASSVSYKKAGVENTGKITSGLGAIAPYSNLDLELESKIANKIVFPLIDGLAKQKMSYVGILSLDVIVDDRQNVFLLECNSNFSNPDCQTIMPLVEEDLLMLIKATTIGALGDEYQEIAHNNLNSASVVITSSVAPTITQKSEPIEIEEIIDDGVYLFHENTAKNIYSELVSTGGKVLTLTASASTLSRAVEKLYDNIENIKFNSMKYRKDIGFDFVKKL